MDIEPRQIEIYDINLNKIEKNEIYFGKEILQNQIAEIQLIEMISSIGK